jgi:hypothetical protein
MRKFNVTRIISESSYCGSILGEKYNDSLIRMLMNREEKRKRDNKIHMVAIAQ